MEVLPVVHAVSGKGVAKPDAAEVKGAFAARLKEGLGQKKAVAGTKKQETGQAPGAPDAAASQENAGAKTGEGPVGPVVLAQIQVSPGVLETVVPVAATQTKDSAAPAKVSAGPLPGKKMGAAEKAEVKADGALKIALPGEAAPALAPIVEKVCAAPAVMAGVSHAVTAVTGKVVKAHGTESTTAETMRAETGRAPEEARTLLAAPNVLEVGVAGGAHGWLRVRAELGAGGEVTAQVITASAGAAENLHKEVPAMQAYLNSEQVGLSSLVVNAAVKSDGAQDAAMGFASGTKQGQQSREQGGQRAPGENTESEMGLGWFGGSGMGVHVGLLAASQGSWLSVRV